MANITSSKTKKIRQLIHSGKLTAAQRQRLLDSLKALKECGGTGNIGGETDIVNQDNLVSEDEFTSGTKPERKVVAKAFNTNADFDSYVNQHRGIAMTPKEQQALVVTEQTAQPPTPSNQPAQPPPEEPDDVTITDPIRITKSITFTNDTEGANILADFLEELKLNRIKPTQQDKFFTKYESADEYGENTTTIIKKQKEGNQFCWTAYSTIENADEDEETNNNDGGAEGGNSGEDELPDLGSLK